MSNNLPHGLSREDLIHVGEIEGEDCAYLEDHGDHDWRCAECDFKWHGYVDQPPQWEKRKISHASCEAEEIFCYSCHVREDI